MAKTIDMTQGKPMGLIFRFAVPLICGNLFQQLYFAVDSIIVGRFVGANAFAATGATGSLCMVFMSLLMGSAIGSGVVISQYFGAKNEEKIASSITNAAYVNAAFAIIISILGMLLTRPLLQLTKVPAELMEDAVTYMLICMGTQLAVTAYYAAFSVLRALGDSKTPLVFMVVSCLTNIVLDLLFVAVFHWGVAGASWATGISEALVAILCIIYAFRKNKYVRMALKYKKPDSNLIKQAVKLSLPTGLQYALVNISSSFLQTIVNGFGKTAVGAFSATTRVENVIQQPYVGVGSAMMTYAGQNIGAGKKERIKEGVSASIKISAIFSVIFLALFWLLGKPVMSVFVEDAAITSTAIIGIRISSLFFMGLGLNQIFRYMFSGAGDANFALLNGAVEVISRILLAVILTAIPFIGMWGIWLTNGFAWLLTCVFAIFHYRTGKWMNKSLTEERTE